MEPEITLHAIKSKVEEIKKISSDDEKAHALEDELYILVLMAIAEGCLNPKELASAALEARNIYFSRWCA
jgi:hypothetical protein